MTRKEYRLIAQGLTCAPKRVWFVMAGLLAADNSAFSTDKWWAARDEQQALIKQLERIANNGTE